MADQRHADVAAGGDGFLVAWAEEGASLIGLNLTDLNAARLDSAGSLVDEEPTLLSTAEHIQWPPRVAWNGSAWLVVYCNERPTDFYLEEDVVAVRVSADGQLLDAEPIVVASDVAGEAGDPDVAETAGGWTVVWPQFNASGVRGVRGARITPDGTVLDPGGVSIWYDTSNTYAVNPRVEWNGSHHLVTWTRFTHDLVPRPPSPSACRASWSPTSPRRVPAAIVCWSSDRSRPAPIRSSSPTDSRTAT